MESADGVALLMPSVAAAALGQTPMEAKGNISSDSSPFSGREAKDQPYVTAFNGQPNHTNNTGFGAINDNDQRQQQQHAGSNQHQSFVHCAAESPLRYASFEQDFCAGQASSSFAAEHQQADNANRLGQFCTETQYQEQSASTSEFHQLHSSGARYSQNYQSAAYATPQSQQSGGQQANSGNNQFLGAHYSYLPVESPSGANRTLANHYYQSAPNNAYEQAYTQPIGHQQQTTACFQGARASANNYYADTNVGGQHKAINNYQICASYNIHHHNGNHYGNQYARQQQQHYYQFDSAAASQRQPQACQSDAASQYNFGANAAVLEDHHYQVNGQQSALSSHAIKTLEPNFDQDEALSRLKQALPTRGHVNIYESPSANQEVVSVAQKENDINRSEKKDSKKLATSKRCSGQQTSQTSDTSAQQKLNNCNICGRNYARPSTLKTHLRTHTNERPYKCKICGKTFSQAANLTAHQRVHTGERPFSCPICRRPFSQSSSVITHLRTHSGERPYRCDLCNRTFSDSSTLTKHCRIHSGEKPYRCEFCPLNFSQSGNLSRHIKLHLSGSLIKGRVVDPGRPIKQGTNKKAAPRSFVNTLSTSSSSSWLSPSSGIGSTQSISA